MLFQMEEITVEVQRKRIKNWHLVIKQPDGRVHLSAPMQVTDRQIEALLSSKLAWIRKHQARFSEQTGTPLREYATGESLPVFGQIYTLRVVESDGKAALRLSEEEAILSIARDSTADKRKACVNEWYRARLKEQIEIYLPKWEAITGLHPSAWQIRSMTGRWGSCNTRTHKLHLSLLLAQKPTACLEYVILHELAHIKVSNHGKDFTAILDRYMPNWRDLRCILNGRQPRTPQK